VERLDLVDLFLVERFASVANLVAVLPVDLLADKGGDELVPAHADRAMDPPHGKDDPVAAESAVPGERCW
jgi:hypothetical protein